MSEEQKRVIEKAANRFAFDTIDPLRGCYDTELKRTVYENARIGFIAGAEWYRKEIEKQKWFSGWKTLMETANAEKEKQKEYELREQALYKRWGVDVEKS